MLPEKLTDEEIAKLPITIERAWVIKPIVWRKAFNYYNSKNDKPLSMSCIPCYMKVLSFILNDRFGLI